MSLSPPTDIVLEVARAADPARAAAVTNRLAALAGDGAASPTDFAHALNAAAPAPVATPASAGPAAPKLGVAQKLESLLLGQFVTEMLPKDADAAFGGGYAGEMWRSMLAEKVADQMAASGKLGIAKNLFASHLLPGASGKAAMRAAATQANAAQAEGGAFLAARAGGA